MAVFDFLKNKQNKQDKQKVANSLNARAKREKEKSGKQKTQTANNPSVKEAEGISVEVKKPLRGGMVINKSAYRVLMAPILTEKSTDQAENNQYVFKVAPDTTKNEVKKAVEVTYNVDVLAVNIANIPRKKRRIGKHIGWRQGYKKAVVTVKEGQKIEIIAR
ncbi:MAG: 50S ribosomal protein L23 [bacterium]